MISCVLLSIPYLLCGVLAAVIATQERPGKPTLNRAEFLLVSFVCVFLWPLLAVAILPFGPPKALTGGRETE